MLPDQVFTDATVAFSAQAALRGMLLSPDRHAELAPRLFWSRPDVLPFLPTAIAREQVPVRCEAGRWLVDCPFCASAQLAARQDPRFFCVCCLCEQVGGKWLRVLWPKPKDLLEIERALRPRLTSQAHYEPGESVADLLAQNTLPGVLACAS